MFPIHIFASHRHRLTPKPFAMQVSQYREEVWKRIHDRADCEDKGAGLHKATLTQINKAAVALARAGDHEGAVAMYLCLFARTQQGHLTHQLLHVCYSNRAASLLALQLHEDALRDADVALTLVEKGSPGVPRRLNRALLKGLLRKGQALLGLQAWRQAAAVFEEGLEIDPSHADMKAGLQQSQQAMLLDLLAGKGLERRALPPSSVPASRITFHPHSAPLHRIQADEVLPHRLLTPFQAECDHHVRDVYNFVTVQTDIRMPKHYLRYLDDTYRLAKMEQAITCAVQRIVSRDLGCRVLVLGAGPGVLPLMALQAGACHVTCVERWLYLAQSCREVLLHNKVPLDQFTVVCKRPCDLTKHKDVPQVCNLLVCDMLDDGLLTSGLVPAMSHALMHFMTHDALCIPASASVTVQAVQATTKPVCGLDVSGLDRYRWYPSQAVGMPLAPGSITQLSLPSHAWHLNFCSPPECTERKQVDLTFTTEGLFNAAVFWYHLTLLDDITLSTGFESTAAGLRSLQPAIQYLAGPIRVKEGMVMPLLTQHNTMKFSFDMEEAEYEYLVKADASVPWQHFNMVADGARLAAYHIALQRAVDRRRAAGEEVHAVDLGTGSGVLAMLAAQAGASSTVAAEAHDTLCTVARKNVAMNGLSDKVTVVHCNVAELQRGRDVRWLGANLLVLDLFDAGLLGSHVLGLLEFAKQNILQPGADVLPCAASVYCMGVELLSSCATCSVAPFNKHRWDKNYEAVYLSDMPHKRLTLPAKVFEFKFDEPPGSRPASKNLLTLEVEAAGVMNTIVFWFDLHIDNETSITSAPPGIQVGGTLGSSSSVLLNQLPMPGKADEVLSSDMPISAAATHPIREGTGHPGLPQGRQETAAAVMEAAVVEAAAAAATTTDNSETDGPGSCSHEGGLLPAKTSASAISKHAPLQPNAATADTIPALPLQATAAAAAAAAAITSVPPLQATAVAAAAAATTPMSPMAAAAAAAAGPQHYWGQALQHLDFVMAVQPGQAVQVLAQREGSRISFALRPGQGVPAPKSPWKVEWGGGSSVENPHYQRVHYCDLLISDFLQRVPSGRFPSVERDLQVMVAHCGNLYLDPASLADVYCRLVLLERLAKDPRLRGVLPEAVMQRPLRWQ